jgi:uncharacterized glyoxalase superfamily protein PhnB
MLPRAVRRTHWNKEDAMATATLRVQKLQPVLTVNDLKKSLRLYTEGLGFVVTEKEETDGELRGVMLEAGEAVLGLSQDDFKKGRDRTKGVGMRLYLETDQDLQALARQAKGVGVTMDGDLAPLPWGPLGFTVTDPDGFKITISNPA